MSGVLSARVDSWLWAVRVFKTRSAATSACRSGHVRVNGERVKASHAVKANDEVKIRVAGFDRVLVVQQVFVKRIGAPLAALAYRDNSPPMPTPETTGTVPSRDRGAGRPTKRERRTMDKFRRG